MIAGKKAQELNINILIVIIILILVLVLSIFFWQSATGKQIFPTITNWLNTFTRQAPQPQPSLK